MLDETMRPARLTVWLGRERRDVVLVMRDTVGDFCRAPLIHALQFKAGDPGQPVGHFVEWVACMALDPNQAALAGSDETVDALRAEVTLLVAGRAGVVDPGDGRTAVCVNVEGSTECPERQFDGV